jgi:hypothetical protein
MLFCVARPQLISFFFFFFSQIFDFSSANSCLIIPEAFRATNPVDDIKTLDPSCPSLSPRNSILLPIGKIPSYLDTALKSLTLHTEARTSFITYTSTLLPPISSPIFIVCVSTFDSKLPSDGTLSKFFPGTGLFGHEWAHANIGCRVYSNTNTSSHASSRCKECVGAAHRNDYVGAPVSHTLELYSSSRFGHHHSSSSSPHLHRLIIHPTPRPPAQDDCERIEDRSALTATRHIPFLQLSSLFSGLGQRRSPLAATARHLVYLSH